MTNHLHWKERLTTMTMTMNSNYYYVVKLIVQYGCRYFPMTDPRYRGTTEPRAKRCSSYVHMGFVYVEN